jgi:hypothetical protein
MKLKKAYYLIARQYGEEIAHTLFISNPLNAIRGEDVDIPAPIPLESRKKRIGFLSIRGLLFNS